MNGLCKNVTRKIDYILKGDPERVIRNNFNTNYSHQGRRCYKCIKNCSTQANEDKIGKSKEQCENCEKSICREHSMVICDDCNNSRV